MPFTCFCRSCLLRSCIAQAVAAEGCFCESIKGLLFAVQLLNQVNSSLLLYWLLLLLKLTTLNITDSPFYPLAQCNKAIALLAL